MSVYIVNSKGTNNYKIGYSNNIESRMKQLQTSNACEIILIEKYDCKDAWTLETRIKNHQKLFKNKQKGEWYDLTEEELFKCQELVEELRKEVNKKMEENTCKKCGYSTYKNDDFRKHQHKHKIEENCDKNNGARYKCDKCARIFSKKQNYEIHIKRKFSCESIAPQLTDVNQNLPKSENSNHKCNYCGKEFCNKYTLERHLNDRCKIKKDDTNKKEEIFQLLLKKMEDSNKKQIDELKNEIIKLKKEIANKHNTTNTNNGTMNNICNQTNNTNNTNNQQNIIKQLNINLVAHGKEDLSFITEERLKTLFYKGFKSIENLTEMVHFDKNRPENHNIYISNIKDTYVMKYDGDDWKLMNRENCLHDMYEDKSDYLVEKFEELQPKLNEQTIKRFGNFLNKRDDDKIIEQTKKEIKLILYNNRKIPEETRRLLRLNDDNVLEQLC
ncbi:MAG: GIY-YIG nuclease [Terrestrivirus sp.]|uniref:GIY-YIG nuclease n=1 Tax=Terrestrivirus sp. TaxID=2487775 RepID=A0A3G4ZNB5_9VIRU|nr:MAG: GIY-YIG nuclease [Terrestrivirus sp.]